MSVASKKPYEFASSDHVDNFHGLQLLYVGWDRHLLFPAPFCFMVPPDMPFKDFVQNVLTATIAYHPETEKIDWSAVIWLKSGKSFAPNFEASIADNGLVHKDVLRFQTPGLPGILGPEVA